MMRADGEHARQWSTFPAALFAVLCKRVAGAVARLQKDNPRVRVGGADTRRLLQEPAPSGTPSPS